MISRPEYMSVLSTIIRTGRIQIKVLISLSFLGGLILHLNRPIALHMGIHNWPFKEFHFYFGHFLNICQFMMISGHLSTSSRKSNLSPYRSEISSICWFGLRRKSS